MKAIRIFLTALCGIISMQLIAQDRSLIKPEVIKAAFFEKTIPLQEMQAPAKKYISSKEIWNLNEPEITPIENPLPFLTDPVLQNYNGTGPPAKVLIRKQVLSNPGYSVPPDAQGDVGLDHYFHSVNVSFVVLDKSGKPLYGPVPNMTLWQNFPQINTVHGDPITIYDHLADRWLTSMMASIDGGPVYYELIAISETSDPLGSWYAYAFELDALPDYPKFGLWHNGYYWAGNMYSFITGEWKGPAAFALQRDQMLLGNPDALMLRFQTAPVSNIMMGPFSFLPSNLTGEPENLDMPNYFMYYKDNAWGFPDDFLSIWECNVDWNDTASCSFAEVSQLITEPLDANFDNFTFITQPHPNYKLQSLSIRLMFRLDFRHFDGYDAMVTNHTVDCDGTDHAGVRWYELRDYGSGWMIHQQGTYAPDSDHRWMASASMDEDGNIAIGYSVSGDQTYPSVRATGRRASDTLGVMTVPEFSIMEGGGSQTSIGDRWGDYTCMSLDPVDQNTFWYVNQYYTSNSSYAWKTALGGFYLSSDSGMHTGFSPDTILFSLSQQMSQGIDLHVINQNSISTSIIYNDPYGEFHGTGINWYVSSSNQPPFFINAADTHTFNIRVLMTEALLAGDYLYDTMHLITSLDTHSVIIGLADSLIVHTPPVDKKELSELKIYPNPAHDKVNISFSLPTDEDITITMVDMKANVIKEFTDLASNDNRYSLDLKLNNEFPSGVYLLIFSTPKMKLTKKLLVMDY